MSTLRALLALTSVVILLVHGDHKFGLCNLPFCVCTPAMHPAWSVVNCSVPPNQKLDILEGDIPDETTDLIISGAEALMFGPNSLTHLSDPRQIYVTKTKLVLIRKSAAVQLNVLSFYLDIEHCELLRFEEKAFDKLKGPLSVTIRNCSFVSTASEAFSWLLKMKLTNVDHLQLSEGSFALDPSAGNVGEHGPGMTVIMKNVILPEIPAMTFGSSAAAIVMDNVKINEIQAGAFSANTYNTVMALNCSIQNINENAFSQRSLINTLNFYGCSIRQLSSRALQSAVGVLNISHTTFDNINPGAINITVASAEIESNTFHQLSERGIELSSWTRLSMKRNSFDELYSDAIVAVDSTIKYEQSAHEVIFIENEIETLHPGSLKLIGITQGLPSFRVVYRINYYGEPCNCNISKWLAKALQVESAEAYEDESYCTIDEFLARCFNVPEQNMLLDKFFEGVCQDDVNIHCESYSSNATEIKNPRFPHKNKEEEGLSARNAKVIGIVLVTCLGCVLLVMLISLIRWMRRKGYFFKCNNEVIAANSTAGSFCDRICPCGTANGVDNARSISRLSVYEYSERHRLNEPTRAQAIVQETSLTDEVIPTDNKATQTLPEELTKEILDNLKKKLDTPENFMEAREMIEHLYELTKLEETSPGIFKMRNRKENIYDLPYQDTAPRLGRNKKEMVSIGTRTPSLDKLLPMSPYYRRTALAHDYFNPLDIAVHLYAEIANSDNEMRSVLGPVPDVVAEPRGPYLQAVREKKNSSPISSASPSTNSFMTALGSPVSTASIKSSSSNTSNKMINRPLPEKPVTLDPGAGTSSKHG